MLDAAESLGGVAHSPGKFPASDKGKDGGDSQAAGRSREGQPQAVHHLAHRIFSHFDIAHQRLFQGGGLQGAAVGLQVVETEVDTGNPLAQLEAIFVVLKF